MEKKRSTIIALLCIWMALGAIFNIFIILLAVIDGMKGWDLALLITSWFIGLVSIIGLWRMRKWAVVLYTVFNIITIIIMIWTKGTLRTETIFLPSVVMVILISQFNKMN